MAETLLQVIRAARPSSWQERKPEPRVNPSWPNPERLGLGPVRAVYVEHSFVTGDRVDVAVELVDGTHAVIEVQVETPTMIGARQALKYRALMAGQRNTTKAPQAFLVAYDIPESTRAFCDRHRIRALSLTPE